MAAAASNKKRCFPAGIPCSRWRAKPAPDVAGKDGGRTAANRRLLARCDKPYLRRSFFWSCSRFNQPSTRAARRKTRPTDSSASRSNPTRTGMIPTNDRSPRSSSKTIPIPSSITTTARTSASTRASIRIADASMAASIATRGHSTNISDSRPASILKAKSW